MRHLISLYALLTTPMPVPRQLLLRAAAILLAYAAAFPIAPQLEGIGLSVMKFGVAAGLIVTMLWAAAGTQAKIDQQGGHYGFWVGTWGAMLAAPFLMPTDLTLAYAIALGYAAYGGIIWAMWKLDPTFFVQQGWAETTASKGTQNLMLWALCRDLWTAFALLALAQHSTSQQWLLGYAVLPLAFHYLFWWTVAATHPTQDDPD